MTTIDPKNTGIDGLTSSTTPKRQATKELGQVQFLELMIAQLKNQDPMKPLQNGEFLSQMAQFGTVNGIQDLQKTFSGLASSLQSNQALMASSLVGRNVWNESGVAFSRPIRWFVALLGDQVIPFEYAGVPSGNVTRGLRPYDSPEIIISSADQYIDKSREAGILLDKEERKASIVEQVSQAASLVGGEAIIEAGLLSEVANLVEMPTAVMGGFEQEYLSLPRDVLISVMKKHQRYFPVQRVGTEHAPYLLPHFIAVRNGDDLYIEMRPDFFESQTAFSHLTAPTSHPQFLTTRGPRPWNG